MIYYYKTEFYFLQKEDCLNYIYKLFLNIYQVDLGRILKMDLLRNH